MNPHKTLSSYLARPDLTPRRQRNWGGFRTQFMYIRRTNRGLPMRALGAFLMWIALIASLNYLASPKSHTDAKLSSGGSYLSQSITSPTATLASMSSVTHAAMLPGGPTGQPLPPGSMAPDHTFSNSYAWGNCTWYVAGRRQVPSNWGNAVSWYYHAVAGGWHVGTTPAVAAIAWTPAGYYGHVALVENISSDGKQVYVSEMNYRGLGIKSYRWVSASAFKYIY